MSWGAQLPTPRLAPTASTARVQEGNKKYCAKAGHGNYSWGSECCTHKTRIMDVAYNASNNELVCTRTLAKRGAMLIHSTPYRRW
ncbi:40S ribosomal protein S8 [Plecturocebus cupreus]